MIKRAIGRRIKQLRSMRGVSQEALAYQIDMARSYLAEVETGKRNVSVGNLQRIIEGLDLTWGEFFSTEEFFSKGGPQERAAVPGSWYYISGGRSAHAIQLDAALGTVDMPLLASIAAGAPESAVETGETFPVPVELTEAFPEAVLLRVSGDSMDNVVPDGAVALVEPCSQADSPNQAYIVQTGSGETTLKRIERKGDAVILVPDSSNPTNRPIAFDPSRAELEQLTVLGRAVWFTVPVGSA